VISLASKVGKTQQSIGNHNILFADSVQSSHPAFCKSISRQTLKGIDKYTSADFEKGAPIVLMVIKSTVKLALPDGSYVARIQYRPSTKSGTAIFTDAGGKEFAKQDLDKPIWTVLDDPFPDPGDFGKSPSDVCSDYLVLFPRMVLTPIPGAPPGTGPGPSFPCRDCACAAYEWRRAQLGGRRPLPTEKNAWDMGRDAGEACLKSPTSECAALP
jgi:hypothetical protein